jgi:hypothetical protein
MGRKDRRTVIASQLCPCSVQLDTARAIFNETLLLEQATWNFQTRWVMNCRTRNAIGYGSGSFTPPERVSIRRLGSDERHHLHETVVQRAVAIAARQSGITKRATCHSFASRFCDSSARAWL